MPVPEPKVGDVVAGKYRVESVLGRGGMGVVYAARHTISERRVAVKWMEADLQGEPDALERFVREARAMGRIEHPNVVGVLDVGTEGDVAYLVMDILRGESLRAMMTRTPRMPAEKALATLLPALEGVEAAHRAGVVHRDLKPENLFVVHDAAGHPTTTKVLDFGISKLTESESKRREAKRLTKTGHVVGTPTYMSPEQVRGTTIDARSDVWSLSTILYEMLAGRTPFEGDNYGALLVAIAVEPYEPLDPRVVAPDLARVVHKGLAKEPEDRWQSVLELARALEPFAPGRKFHEPRRPSVAPPPHVAAAPITDARASALPTLDAGGRRTTPDDVGGEAPPLATPPLATPPTRAAAPARAAAPTPVRLQRPSASAETVSSPGAAPGATRRWVTVAAVGLAVIVALVLVIRGIGNAARDAMLRPDPTSSAAEIADAPTIPEPTPLSVGAAPPESTTTPDAPEPGPPSAPDVAPAAPPPTTTPTHTHHEGHVHAPPTTTAASPPTTTTSATEARTPTSRSGSISRDDF